MKDANLVHWCKRKACDEGMSPSADSAIWIREIDPFFRFLQPAFCVQQPRQGKATTSLVFWSTQRRIMLAAVREPGVVLGDTAMS